MCTNVPITERAAGDWGSRANGKRAALGVWYVDAAHKANPDRSDYDVWMAVAGELLQ